MQTNPNQPWREWLEAEAQEREDAADAAFASLMAEAPRVEVSAAFVERTMTAVRSRRARERRLQWSARTVAAVAVAVTAAAGVWAGGALLADALANVLVAAVRGLLWTTEAMGGGLRWWAVLARFGSAIATAAATPLSMAVLVALQVVGALAMYGMKQLLGDEPAAQEEARV